ncbi:MAG: PTS transporter subunit EIIB [Christensenellales bacterium]
MDYNKVAKDILDNVGGKANVKQVTHCFTRLRFVLRDESKAKRRSLSIWRVSSRSLWPVASSKWSAAQKSPRSTMLSWLNWAGRLHPLPKRKPSPRRSRAWATSSCKADRDLYSAGARHCSFRPNQGSSGRLCQDARL